MVTKIVVMVLEAIQGLDNLSSYRISAIPGKAAILIRVIRTPVPAIEASLTV